MGSTTARNYLWASAIHWPPRQKALMRILHTLNNRNRRYRIVDIGCGPGLLVSDILGLNFNYLGIDTEKSIITYCREKYADTEGIAFLDEDLSRVDGVCNAADIVVLNGVVHHLSQDKMDRLIDRLTDVRHVIILDHYRPSSKISFSHFIPFVLQNLDKGKFVRRYDWYNEISDFHIEDRQVFPIKFAGIKLWDYFCHYYCRRK